MGRTHSGDKWEAVEIFREGLPDKVIFEQKFEGDNSVSHWVSYRMPIPGRRNSWCKDPGVRTWWTWLRNNEKTGVE